MKWKLERAEVFILSVLIIWAFVAVIIMPFVLAAFVDDRFLALNMVTVPAGIWAMLWVDRYAQRPAPEKPRKQKPKHYTDAEIREMLSGRKDV